MGLGNEMFCAERVVSSDPFMVLPANDFLTDYDPGVTADLVNTLVKTGKTQLSLMEVNGPEISKYGVVISSA